MTATEHNPTTDAELIEDWLKGDAIAGEKLIRMHEPSVRRFFQNKLSSEADDLVQETLTAAVAGRERFEGRSTFRAYLLSIARFRLYEHYRTRQRDQRVFEFDTVTVHDLSPGPSTHAARRSEQRLLWEALRHIPVNAQIILELHYWEELTGPEMADVLEVPLDTAYSRLRNAKALLKKKLELLAHRPAVSTCDSDPLQAWAGEIRSRLAQSGSDPSDSPSSS